MNNTIKRTLSVCLMMTMLALSAFATPSKPYPPRLVNDFANILSHKQEAVLENMLVAFDEKTSNQIVVVTVNDLEGYPATLYANEIGEQWKVGDGRFDNGIVLLVKPKVVGASGKGETAIAVGYGLEGAIPDAYAKRIINSYLIPAFKEGDYYKGIYDACEQLMGLASGEISQIREKRDNSRLYTIINLLLFTAFFISIFYLGTKGGNDNNGGGNGGGNGRYRRDLSDDLTSAIIIGSILGNSRRGSTWGSSRGYSGGGGFGGFGGFGGGSFGGGGASGSW